MRITFRIRWPALLATILLIALGISLGQWQARRAAQKQLIADKLVYLQTQSPLSIGADFRPAQSIEFHKVTVQGEFVRDWPIYIDNRSYQGRAGFYVVMPFRITGSNRHVLVARGWLPRNIAARTTLPPLATPSGAVQLHGTAVTDLGKLLQLGSANRLIPGAIVQDIRLNDAASQIGVSLHPFFIQQENALPDGLIRDWPQPSVGIERHYGYMVTWYGLALMTLLFYLITGIRRQPAHD